MGVRIKITQDLKDLKKLVPEVRKEFAVIAPPKLRQTIIDDTVSGVSPVDGKGRFVKYSKSYKDQIRGLVAFRKTKSGRTFAIDRRGIKGKGAKKKRGDLSDKISDLNEVFTKNRKSISPVNMRLEGNMFRSFIVKVKTLSTSVVVNGLTLLIGYEDPKAEYHNEGAGQLPERRLLPNKAGEKFNRRINTKVRELLTKSVRAVVKRFS